jgi:hypothetical protein
MKTPKSLAMCSLIAATLLCGSAVAAAHAQDFNLVNASGKTIGQASYTIDKTKTGFKVNSRFRYRATLAADGGNEAAQVSAAELANQQGSDSGKSIAMEFTASYKITANGDTTEATLKNGLTQTTIELQVSKSRDSVSMTRIQGMQPGNPVTMPMPKPDFLVAPDQDPSGMQMLLTTALAHPHPDNTYLLLVPSQSPRGGARAINVELQAPTDATGTLDGKPVALKHYTLKFYEGQAELYTDANGALMEADMTPLHTKYVHTKFELTAPAR